MASQVGRISIVVSPGFTAPQSEFPKLMLWIGNGANLHEPLVVMFTGKTEGTCVSAGTQFGVHQNGWCDCTVRGQWAPFVGTIELKGL